MTKMGGGKLLPIKLDCVWSYKWFLGAANFEHIPWSEGIYDATNVRYQRHQIRKPVTTCHKHNDSYTSLL